MVNEKEESGELTEEGMLVVELTRALFSQDIDEAFRILGRHMDKNNLQISTEVLDEYRLAGRILEA